MTCRRSVLVLLAPLVSGCLFGGPKGEEISAREAPAYFATKREGLERVVALVDACRPDRDDGYNRVWADGSSPEGLRCLREGGDLPMLVAELNRHGFVGVDYSAGEWGKARDPLEPLGTVSVNVYSAGLGVSGVSIDFVHFAQPNNEPVATERREDGSILHESRAVTAAPYHWFWERTT